MACVKFKSNFDLKSYFFYFAQSLFKTPSIRFFISNSILFKYYFYIIFYNYFLLNWNQTSTQKKNPQQLHQQSLATSAKKNPANLQTFTAILQKIIKTRTTPTHQSKITHKPSPSPIWRRRRRSSKRSRRRRRKRRERDGSYHHHQFEEEAAKEEEKEEEKKERDGRGDLRKKQKKKKKKEKKELAADERLKEREKGKSKIINGKWTVLR